ncbi:MAG: CPBP family intramembrane metalloprotease [Anaerolineae bacterium]|nr:CPBP family intramembrane metalloprotease [Anaerolineae bacterium]
MKYLIGEKLNFDWKVVTVTVLSTLLLMVDYYHKIFPQKYLDRLLLYLVIPLFIILVVFRENPRNYGFSFGDWKLGITYTVLGILLMAPVIYYLGHGDASMKKYYDRFLIGLPWTTFFDLLGWEFLFRGWILFAYARKFGHEALWLQAVPFAIAHISKPEIETVSTIFGGFAFGWVAWRTKSFIYPLLIHWFIGTFIILVAAGVI